VPLFLLFAVVFGTATYLARTVDRRLKAAIAAADRDDRWWRLNDLMAHREVVPDAENAALVVGRALALLPARWPAGPAPRAGGPNAPGLSAEEALDRLTATEDNVRLYDAIATALRTELDAHQEAVQIARTVAAYHRGRHEVILGPNLIDTPLPESQAAPSAARLLAADAALRAHDGELDGALDSCRAILGVGWSIGDEPFLISQLARMAIGRTVAMKSARRVLGQGEPSDAALAALQAAILDELAQPLLLHGVKRERAVLHELIRRLGAGEVSIAEPGGDRDRDRGSLGHKMSRIVLGPWITFKSDYQRAVALEWMNEVVAIARRPAAERAPLWEALEANVNRVKQSRFEGYFLRLSIELIPALSAALRVDALYQGELGATAVLLAAERQRRKSGDWPASIAAIDAEILPAPPVDPFSGQAFRMEHRAGQIVIYSVGPNGKDEHGAFDPKRWQSGGPDDVGAVAWDVELRGRPGGK
jgi:hypothetical protein